MKVQLVGCSHHNSSVAVRERLAFPPDKAVQALADLKRDFPGSEAVLLSTCNRVEIYAAAEQSELVPTHDQVVEFMARCHGLRSEEIFNELFERSGEAAVRHLFTVASSLDSMVVGEPQIVSQVKQAYDLANEQNATGTMTHQIFQAALRVAKRVSSETGINEHRLSIPSVAVAEFARQIFESFHDKQVVVIGAGEMAEETLRYLHNEGATHITVINRNIERARSLADQYRGQTAPWEQLGELLVRADLIVSTTGATQPIVSLADFQHVEARRFQRPLFILDLAVPRDFDPSIGDRLGVYLYSLDDLKEACKANRAKRDQQMPLAIGIVEQETRKFMADLNHRATAPIVKRLREGWQQIKNDELVRLFQRLPQADEKTRQEIDQAFERLTNKLLHPPLNSLRDEAQHGVPHGLLDALRKLFHLWD